MDQLSDNLKARMDSDAIAELTRQVIDGHEIDKTSMQEWLEDQERAVEAMRMADRQKDYPFEGCANARFPMIAVAAMQFNARAYPALVPSDGPVKVKAHGGDEKGLKAARATRVQDYMSYQLPMMGWEEQIDELLFQLPASGSRFRKVWYDRVLGVQTKNCDVVYVNNNCPSLSRMPRIGEEFSLYPHEIQERILGGRYEDFTYEDRDAEPCSFIEQMCRYDADGDGYPEPVIATVHMDTETLVRVEANYRELDITRGQDGRVQRIKPRDYYLVYNFLPSADGTFLGLGLGRLLGNVSELIDGTFNQMLDASHLASLGGGFIGQGLNLKGSQIRIRPGQYQTVNTGGAAIRDAIVPMTFPGPSQTLFSMLGLLIESSKEIASINSSMSGEVVGNMQPTTLLAMIEQGEKVFTGAYKRIYRAMRREFAMICQINAETLSQEAYAKYHDVPVDVKADFDLTDMDISPVADPREATNMQRLAKAQLLMQLADQGKIDPQEATRRVLEAAGIADIAALMPEPDPAQAQMQAMKAQMAEALQMAMAEAKLHNLAADTDKKRSEIVENRAEAALDTARASEEMSINRVELMLRISEAMSRLSGADDGRSVGGMAAAPGNFMGSAPVARSGGLPQGPDLAASMGVGGGPANPQQGSSAL